VHFYRYLYTAVGEPWLWFERRLIDDAALAMQIHSRRSKSCLVHARRPRRFFRARHGGAARHEAVLFRASTTILSGAGWAPICCRPRSTRRGPGRSIASGCTPPLSTTQRRWASTSRPASSSMPAARYYSKTRGSGGFCRATLTHRLLPAVGLDFVSLAQRDIARRASKNVQVSASASASASGSR